MLWIMWMDRNPFLRLTMNNKWLTNKTTALNSTNLVLHQSLREIFTYRTENSNRSIKSMRKYSYSWNSATGHFFKNVLIMEDSFICTILQHCKCWNKTLIKNRPLRDRKCPVRDAVSVKVYVLVETVFVTFYANRPYLCWSNI